MAFRWLTLLSPRASLLALVAVASFNETPAFAVTFTLLGGGSGARIQSFTETWSTDFHVVCPLPDCCLDLTSDNGQIPSHDGCSYVSSLCSQSVWGGLQWVSNPAGGAGSLSYAVSGVCVSGTSGYGRCSSVTQTNTWMDFEETNTPLVFRVDRTPDDPVGTALFDLDIYSFLGDQNIGLGSLGGDGQETLTARCFVLVNGTPVFDDSLDRGYSVSSFSSENVSAVKTEHLLAPGIHFEDLITLGSFLRLTATTKTNADGQGADESFGCYGGAGAGATIAMSVRNYTTVDVKDGRPGGSFEVRPCRPNPASSEVGVAFDLPTVGRLTVEFLTSDGRRVRKLAQGEFSPGQHAVAWNLRDDRGRSVPAGVYFCRLSFAGKTLTEKVAVTH
jgi:hypothetical protein